MKIFRCEQIRQIDDFTIRNEPVKSADLMERAARRLFDWYVDTFRPDRPVYVFAGPGNNGGDGLALARMLAEKYYRPEVFFINITGNISADWKINKERLDNETDVPFSVISDISQFPELKPGSVIIDAIFGSGLTRPASGLALEVIKRINDLKTTVISIDIPSGLYGEDNGKNDRGAVIKATCTLSFQFPKLSFLFAENEIFTGRWVILDIGLHPDIIERTETPFSTIQEDYVCQLIPERHRFDHKGTFGHALIAGGSYGKMGAVVLGARAALRTGAGLVTCHIPASGNFILQSAVPEAMVKHDASERIITKIENPDGYTAVAAGPGMGTETESQNALHDLLISCSRPMVIDADAINILSLNRKWLSLLKPGTILTPHPGEFERLAGKTDNGYERLKRQMELASGLDCIIVLKGAFTSVAAPDGRVWFNTTGNPGMATAGSGDVLTGMIAALLARRYKPLDAAITAVYIHGLAGDIAASKRGFGSLISSDIIEMIGSAYIQLAKTKK